MILDMAIVQDRRKAFDWLKDKIVKQHGVIEIKVKQKKRTIKQNAYLHIIIQIVAIAMGLTVEETKTHLKRRCDMMVYEKNGEKFLRSSADLDTKEMTQWVEWIRNYSSYTVGCYVPTPEEYLINQFKIQQEIDKYREYL